MILYISDDILQRLLIFGQLTTSAHIISRSELALRNTVVLGASLEFPTEPLIIKHASSLLVFTIVSQSVLDFRASELSPANSLLESHHGYFHSDLA